MRKLEPAWQRALDGLRQRQRGEISDASAEVLRAMFYIGAASFAEMMATAAADGGVSGAIEVFSQLQRELADLKDETQRALRTARAEREH